MSFNQCDIFNVLLFSMFQKINALYLFVGLIQLTLIDYSFIHFIYNMIKPLTLLSNSYIMYGHVSLFVLVIFIVLLICSMHNKKYIKICILIILYIPNQAWFYPFYSVDFINVGQGDSILIRAPFNLYNILIDIPLNKEDIVIDYLHAVGINKIDTLIFTHNDSDHNGGKELFVSNFKVDEIVEENKDILNTYIKLLSINHLIYDNDNDNSLVYYTSIGNISYCMLGDVSKEVEMDLINSYDLECDVIKIAHHGSQTSTNPFFIQKTNPTIAIISASKNNRYGHPHQSVIDTLNNYEVSVYETSKKGTISIKNFLNFNFITTSSLEFGIILVE